jgi:signal transduction histidine kinase
VKALTAGAHRKLLFRSYVFLTFGLVAVAIVLDAGFTMLASRLGTDDDVWLDRAFALIEAEAGAVPPEQRSAVAARLGSAIGVAVQVLERADVVVAARADGRIAQLRDDSGDVSYLRDAPSFGGAIRIGPIEPQRQSVALRLLPPLFYLSIFVIVGLWLRPLLRDLDSITLAAQRFAADYREPIEIASQTTELSSLALNLDEMSARLSSLLQSQKELAAALSHEMRTPIARIRFAVAVLGHDADDELRRQLDAIAADVQEIDGLLASILSYARLDHPDLRMNWQHTPVAGWLEQTLATSRQPAIDVEVVREPAFDTARMDPRLMALAVSNLIVNACRYGRSKVRVTAARDARDYLLAVEDDGDGIPAAERETIFKPFTRLDSSRSRDTGGYGLGLAIVARVAALHGGAVAVDSSVTLGGARFTLRWPEAA